jgi:hypothetical protein
MSEVLPKMGHKLILDEQTSKVFPFLPLPAQGGALNAKP